MQHPTIGHAVMKITARVGAAIALAIGTCVLPSTGDRPAAAQEKQPTARVSVIAPWARATPGGVTVAGGFLEMRAAGGMADRLIGATSPVAGTVELHTHTHESGVMRMRRVEAIEVPAGASVTLKPGGLHLMLMELKQPLKAGERVPLTLRFEKAGEVAVSLEVARIGAMGPPGSATEPDQGGHAGSGSGSGSGSGDGRGSHQHK